MKTLTLLIEDGRNLLMHSILDSKPSIEIIEFLIDQGININHLDSGQGWSALHFAAQDNKVDIVNILLNAGAKIDVVDNFGNTPLWRSIMSFNGNSETINFLLAHNANPKIKNYTGVSAENLAMKLGKEYLLSVIPPKNRSVDK